MSTQEMFTVKPGPGRRVRDPASLAPLKDDGELKPKTTYWLRRLADGDVVEVSAEAPVVKRKLNSVKEP